MSSISGVMATAVALTQARVQGELAARLMKVTQEVGAPAQMLELVKQAAESAAQLTEQAATASLDLTA